MTSPSAVAPLGVADPVTVGPYTLRGRIGAGGMGMVYLADDPAGTPVAVKIIRPELAEDPKFRDRFRREAAAAQRVPRFCTAAVRDVDPHGTYLVTDYLPGPTLSHAVRPQPLAGANLEQLAINIATALTMIHSVGVVHRDLKPSNVLLSPTGARVIDFGIAAAHDMTVIRGPGIGTPAYMPPEAWDGAPPSPAMDIWAWGGLVLFAATGKPPFPLEPDALLPHRVRHEQPAHLHRLSGSLLAAVTAALAKDPATRPTAAELYQQLTGPTPIPSTPTRSGTTATSWIPDTLPPHPWSGPPPTPAAPSPAPLPRARRRRTIAIAAVTLAATVLAVTLIRHPTRTLTAAQRTTAAHTLTAAASTTTDPALAARLAVAAWHLDPTRSTSTLITATAGRLTATAETAHAGPVTTLALTPDGQTLATGSEDHTARLWSIRDPDHPVPLATLPHGDAVAAIWIDAAGTLAATSSENQSLHLWDIRDLAAPTDAGTYTITGTAQPLAVLFDPTGPRLVVTTSTGRLLVLDITDPAHLTTLATIPAHTDAFTAAFIPHTNTLVSVGGDSAIRLWNLANPAAPTPIGRITPTGIPSNLAITADGRTLATSDLDGTVSLWDIHDPANPASLTTLRPPADSTPSVTQSTGSLTIRLQGMVYAVAFNPSGSLLAAGDDTGTVRLWNITNPHNTTPSATLHAHTAAIEDLIFTHDGTHLITAADDNTARIWNLTPASLYQRTCATPTSQLTPQEWHHYLPHTPYQPPCPTTTHHH